MSQMLKFNLFALAYSKHSGERHGKVKILVQKGENYNLRLQVPAFKAGEVFKNLLK